MAEGESKGTVKGQDINIAKVSSLAEIDSSTYDEATKEYREYPLESLSLNQLLPVDLYIPMLDKKNNRLPEDLHLAEHFCRCHGKGDKQRLVPLSDTAVEVVSTYLETERPELVAIALNTSGATPIPPDSPGLGRDFFLRYNARPPAQIQQ